MNQYNYIIYEITTGKLISYMTVAFKNDINLQDLTNKHYLLVTDFNIDYFKTHYVLDGKLEPRPYQITTINKNNIIADSIDIVVINNAPTGALFKAWNDSSDLYIEEYINENDTFSTNQTGKIRIEIEKFPFLTFGAIIDAY